MNKILFSILGAFMVSTMASAQYLNVKLKDGTYSFKTSSDTEVSFGEKTGAEIMEPIQVIKLYKGDQVVAEYWGYEVDRVVYEETPPTTGTANAIINGVETSVKWVQLWKNGPKFAEYNIGAENNKPEDYGGYYTWGGKYKNGKDIPRTDDHNSSNIGTGNLTGTDDTATKLWGSKWRMPTQAELEALLNTANCKVEWKDDYNGKAGLLCKGKENTAYASNSVFLPAAGYCGGDVVDQGIGGYYWSSTPSGSSHANMLYFYSRKQEMPGYKRDLGFSVRAVLNENE